MKLFVSTITALSLIFIVNSRVLLNQRKNSISDSRLHTNYPRYLVPTAKSEIGDQSTEERNQERLSLDNVTPKERKLFMMTDYEAQKDRFSQRMSCKFF